jgi:hypothetical protein
MIFTASDVSSHVQGLSRMKDLASSCFEDYLLMSPVKELSHEIEGKRMVTTHRAPGGLKAYIQLGMAWFPKGIVYNTAITTPVPCSLQYNTFLHGLGRSEHH